MQPPPDLLKPATQYQNLDAFEVGIIEMPISTAIRVRVELRECVTRSGLTPVRRVLRHCEGVLIGAELATSLKQKIGAAQTKWIGGLGDYARCFDIERN